MPPAPPPAALMGYLLAGWLGLACWLGVWQRDYPVGFDYVAGLRIDWLSGCLDILMRGWLDGSLPLELMGKEEGRVVGCLSGDFLWSC